MGQHKYNPTAIAAKNGELPPKPKKMSNSDRSVCEDERGCVMASMRNVGQLLDERGRVIGELKPCPFCGCELVGKEEWWRNPHNNLTRKWMVYSHPQKNCILDYHRYHFYNNPYDIDKWNRRANDED